MIGKTIGKRFSEPLIFVWTRLDIKGEFWGISLIKEWVIMKNRYTIIMDVIIWVLFFKGILLIPITLYVTWKALFRGKYSLSVGIASCVAGTFAFSMSCVALWLKSKLETDCD